ncbi:unnamed protein product [marine sediment metagenome]|uniref:Uncharacterized protein n=1 Tax=marine sediment metagenome TaxID=412755 RepID=X1BVX6_9ZZZZ
MFKNGCDHNFASIDKPMLAVPYKGGGELIEVLIQPNVFIINKAIIVKTIVFLFIFPSFLKSIFIFYSTNKKKDN